MQKGDRVVLTSTQEWIMLDVGARGTVAAGGGSYPTSVWVSFDTEMRTGGRIAIVRVDHVRFLTAHERAQEELARAVR